MMFIALTWARSDDTTVHIKATEIQGLVEFPTYTTVILPHHNPFGAGSLDVKEKPDYIIRTLERLMASRGGA